MTGGRLMTKEQIEELLISDWDSPKRKSVVLISKPPTGCYKVLNIYVDQNGKLQATWEDTPAP